MDMEDVEYLEEYEDMMCYGTDTNTSIGNSLPSFQSTFDRFSRTSTGELMWNDKTGIQVIPPPRFCNPNPNVSSQTSIADAAKQDNDSILSNDNFDQWIEEVPETDSPSPLKRDRPYSNQKQIHFKNIQLPATTKSSAVIRQQQSNMNTSKFGFGTQKSLLQKGEKALSITEKIDKLIKPRIAPQNKITKPNQMLQAKPEKNAFFDKMKKMHNSDQIRNEILALKKNLYTSKSPTALHLERKEKLSNPHFRPPTKYSESFQRPVDKRYNFQTLESRIKTQKPTERRDLIQEKNSAFRINPKPSYEKKFKHDDIKAELEYIRKSYCNQADDSDESDTDIFRKSSIKPFNKIAKFVQHRDNTNLQYARGKPQKFIDFDYNKINNNSEYQRKKMKAYLQEKEKKLQKQANQITPISAQKKLSNFEKEELTPSNVETELVLIRGSPNLDIDIEEKLPEEKKKIVWENKNTSSKKYDFKDTKFNLKKHPTKKHKFLLLEDDDSEDFSSSSESDLDQISTQKTAPKRKKESDSNWEPKIRTYKEKIKLNVASKSNWQKPKLNEMIEENVKNFPSRKEKELNILKPKTIIDKSDEYMKADKQINSTKSQKILDEQDNTHNELELSKSVQNNIIENSNQHEEKAHKVTDSETVKELMLNDVRKETKTNVKSKPVRKTKIILKKKNKPKRIIRRVYTKKPLRKLSEQVSTNSNTEDNNISKYNLDEHIKETVAEIENIGILATDTSVVLPEIDDNVEDHDIFKELQFKLGTEPEEVMHKNDKQIESPNVVTMQSIPEKPLNISEKDNLKLNTGTASEFSARNISDISAGAELKTSIGNQSEISVGNNLEISPGNKLNVSTGKKLKASSDNKLEVIIRSILETTTAPETENRGPNKTENYSQRKNIGPHKHKNPKSKKIKMNTIGPRSKQKQVDNKPLLNMKQLKVSLNKNEVERYFRKLNLKKISPAKIEQSTYKTDASLQTDIIKKNEAKLKEIEIVPPENNRTQKRLSGRVPTSTTLLTRKSAKISITNSLNLENSPSTVNAEKTKSSQKLRTKYKSQDDLHIGMESNIVTRKPESNKEINKPTSKKFQPLANGDSNVTNTKFKRVTKRRQSAPPEIEAPAKKISVTPASSRTEAELKRQKIADALCAMPDVPSLSSKIVSSPKLEATKNTINEKVFNSPTDNKSPIISKSGTNRIPAKNNGMSVDANILNNDSISKAITYTTIPSHIAVETRLLTKDEYRRKNLSSLYGTARDKAEPAPATNVVTADSIITKCVDLLNTNIAKEAKLQARRMNVGALTNSHSVAIKRKLNVERCSKRLKIDAKTALTFYHFLSEYFKDSSTDIATSVKVPSTEPNHFVLHNTTITKTPVNNSSAQHPIQRGVHAKYTSENKIIASFPFPAKTKTIGCIKVSPAVGTTSSRVCSYSGKKSTNTSAETKPVNVGTKNIPVYQNNQFKSTRIPPRTRTAKNFQNHKVDLDPIAKLDAQLQRNRNNVVTSTATSGSIRLVSNNMLLSSPPVQPNASDISEECILPDPDILNDLYDLPSIQSNEDLTPNSKNVSCSSYTNKSIELTETTSSDTKSPKDKNDNLKMFVSRTVRRIIVPNTDIPQEFSNTEMIASNSPNSAQTKKSSALVVLFPTRAHSPLLTFDENCEHDMIDKNIKIDKQLLGKPIICTICGLSFIISRSSVSGRITNDEDNYIGDTSLEFPFDKLNISSTYFNDDDIEIIEDDNFDNLVWAKTENNDEYTDLQSIFTSDYSLEAGHQFQCKKCSIILTSRRFILQHIIDVHDENSKLCYICGVYLKLSHLMAHHFANKHSTRG